MKDSERMYDILGLYADEVTGYGKGVGEGRRFVCIRFARCIQNQV